MVIISSRCKFLFALASFLILTVLFAVPVFAKTVDLSINPGNQCDELDEITLAASVTGFSNPEYRFVYRQTGTDQLNFPQSGLGNTWVVTAPAGSAGVYDFGVQVREAGTPGWPYLDVFEGYIIKGPSVELTVEPADQSPAGQELQLTAFATAVANPQYLFGYRVAGGSWREIGSVGESNSEIVEVPAHTPPGAYELAVRVREAGTSSWLATDTVPHQVLSPEDLYSIDNITFEPSSPVDLFFGAKVICNYNYVNNGPGEVLIYAVPLKNDRNIVHSQYGSLPHQVGEGRSSSYFTIKDGYEVTVDKVNVRMIDKNTDELLYETFEEVAFTFKPPQEIYTLQGYEIITKDVFVAGGEFSSRLIAAPEGKVPLSGGAFVLEVGSMDTNMMIRESTYIEDTEGKPAWYTMIKNEGLKLRHVRFFAVFAEEPPGYEVVTMDHSLAAGESLQKLLEVPHGKVVFGGGARVVGRGSGLLSELQLQESAPGTKSFPDPDSERYLSHAGWFNSVTNNAKKERIVRQSVICADPPVGYEIIYEDKIVDAGANQRTLVNLTEDKKVLGGGAKVVGAGSRDFYMLIQEQGPRSAIHSNTWYTSISNQSSADRTVRFYGIRAD